MTFEISSESLEALIDAAIDCEVLHSPGTADFMKQGGYYVFTSATGGGNMILPGRGAPAPDIPDYNTSTEALDPNSFMVNGQTASSMYAKWENRIYQMFYPYKTMPRPEDFDAAVTAFEPLLSALEVQPAEWQDAQDDGGGLLPYNVTGNDAFSVIASASDSFGNMQGLTTDAFKTYFLDRFPYIVQRQYGIAQMLKASVVGEQELWKAMQKDILTLVSEATSTFKSNGQSGQGDVEGGLAIAGVVLSVAALIPAVNVAATVGATIVGVLTALPLPDTTGTPPAIQLPGVGAEEIWASVEKARDDLNKTAGKQEQAFAESMRQIKSVIDSDPSKFDLGSIDDKYGPSDQSVDEEIQNETDPGAIIGVMDINFDIAIQAGQHLIDVSAIFDDVAKKVDSLPGSGAWSRAGDIGMGFIGHFEETDTLAQLFSTYLRTTQHGLVNAGEVVQLVAQQMKAGDENIGQDLRQRQTQMESEPNAYAG